MRSPPSGADASSALGWTRWRPKTSSVTTSGTRCGLDGSRFQNVALVEIEDLDVRELSLAQGEELDDEEVDGFARGPERCLAGDTSENEVVADTAKLDVRRPAIELEEPVNVG